jgi:hypothetical protein
MIPPPSGWINDRARDGITLVERAYIALLRHPHDLWRVKNQWLYCECRAYLAAATGRSEEETQELFEAWVAENWKGDEQG